VHPAHAAEPGNGGTCGDPPGQPSKSRYFAEGYTGEGFREWLCLYNPHDEPDELRLELFFSRGESLSRTLSLSPSSRTTLDINSLAGEGREVSLALESSLPVLAERPMYFLYRGRWEGCTVSTGTPSLSTRWRFAEGCTRDGFEEWLLLANPGSETAPVRIKLTLETGEALDLDLAVPPRSRRTLFVNRVVGGNHDVSASLDSPVPFCAERVMYFDYHGKWEGGHASAGFPGPRRDYFFAEGYTGPGFEEWLCLFPEEESPSSPDRNIVSLKCFFPGGHTEEYTMSLERGRRYTIDINRLVGEGKEVSLAVTSEAPLYAERAMYFDFRGCCRGGHVSRGAEETAAVHRLAEGTTRAGFYTFLCLLNPGEAEGEVEVDYIPARGETLTRRYSIPPCSRLTLEVNKEVGRGLDVSFQIRSSTPLVVERPLYRPGYSFRADNALAHLRTLSVTIGQRVEGTDGELAAALYLAAVLEGYGYTPRIQEVPLPNGSVTRNVIAERAGTEGGAVYLVGGHYDTKGGTGSPGANDNGSGTVVTLELARCFAELPARPDLVFVFFGGEERLVDGTDLHHFGSRRYVESLGPEEKSRLAGAIIVDMVGVGRTLYARTMGIGPMELCNSLTAYASRCGMSLPYLVSGSYSDHEPFEKAGIPAVWLEYKDDPYYHTPADSIDKIDPGHLQTTGRLLEGFLRSL
jgi:hypothetical protein